MALERKIIMNKEELDRLIDLVHTKLCNAKFYKNVCGNELTKEYIKEARQYFEMIIGEVE